MITRAMIVPMASWAYAKLRSLYPSPGVPRKVAALVSAAMMEASTAHQGILCPPRANSCKVVLFRPA